MPVSLNEKSVQKINRILDNVGSALNQSDGLVWFILCSLPMIGKPIKRWLRKKRLIKMILLLDQLIIAFEIGYVPGGGPGLPEKWSYITFFRCFENYHPDNAAYLEEFSELIFERLNDPRVTAKTQSTQKSNRKVELTIGAIMDLEGLSPPLKHQPRKIQFGNPDKQYWLKWAQEIKSIIFGKMQIL